ncbi:alpha/beta hydrolase [Pseudothauera nasutitermitis]|uniref:Alpha/beta hydrolase n=1 Tax=Pseudothauera nasutitermitis TaxID=2565930 RepID=A0A4S4B3P7_9RHOO|nr:alpha/beta hydrolase [Pseudothauera nasutitermitis]THF67300.1 alpha/beta hydrolase [Pseudothauera nasutitermitis]
MSAHLFQPARRLALQLACAALLGACARPPRRGPDGGDPRNQPEKPGYLAEAPYREESFHDVWRTGDEELALEWLLPRDAAQVPLVIYLPGLGEPAGAGLAWRQAWARAGHAVLSFQGADDAGVWSSAAARRGDFSAIARERFGAQALSRRILRTRRLVDDLARRGGDASTPYGRIDWRRVALAGFDLGAQTALAFAGERQDGLSDAARSALDLPMLRAAIALSPPVRAATEDADARLGAIHAPLLLVTAHGLDDPLEPARAAPRPLPFDALPAGDKYLLTLARSTRRTLSGTDEARGAERGTRGSGGGMGDGPSGGFGGGAGPGGGGGMGGMGGGGPGGGGMSGRGPDGGRGGPPPGGEGRGPAGNGRERRLIAELSTAFLDAQLRDQARAQVWLTREAAEWIGGDGELRSK